MSTVALAGISARHSTLVFAPKGSHVITSNFQLVKCNKAQLLSLLPVSPASEGQLVECLLRGMGGHGFDPGP